MSENGEIYTASKNFTLPQAVTSLTNLTSDQLVIVFVLMLAGADFPVFFCIILDIEGQSECKKKYK